MQTKTNVQSELAASLLCIYYPQQLLPALAAVLSFRRHHGMLQTAPLHVLVWSPETTSYSTYKKRLEIFHILLGGFPWATLSFPDPNEVRVHLSHNAKVLDKASYLRHKFSEAKIDAIYYAHDISADFIAQSAMQAFLAAKRICFGDALGVVYSNDYFTELTYPLGNIIHAISQPATTVRNLLFRLKRNWTLPRKDCRLDACYVVPILPCDPGGDFLAGKNLVLVDDASLFLALRTLSQAAERHLDNKNKAITTLNQPPIFVMLLGSYSESRLTSEDQEIRLYIEIADQYVPAGGRIFLKAHPVSQQDKITRITKALSSNFEIIEISADEWPIELMPSLIKGNQVLSLSYSSVSLSYLYGFQVTHVLNRKLINKFFPKKNQSWVLESNELYLQQLDFASTRCPQFRKVMEMEP
ncbi:MULTISPECIES: polysialyltransferase family glycosyltransferase [Chromobacterium]|uniref:polysialyltransferase family glycosyltransferase n=1 Tax=Chromobacterium TaxID=535 RepID=UPI0011B1F752|nr:MULTISPECIES: polysialyltransferase family glycosyltransferase [Chromobacterium]QOD82911.1 hypothetical protein IEZ30_24210 [Chromobacterium haemolyticum]